MNRSKLWLLAPLFTLVSTFGCGDSGGNEDDEGSETSDDESSSEGTGSDATEGTDSSSSSSTGDLPEMGLLGCPTGESCTIVAVVQTLDDRIEFFTARGPGPVYRGSIDLDFKPNPAGDNSGENLDEPFGIAVAASGLQVLAGHYPTRDLGSLLTYPFELLATVPDGGSLAVDDYFASNAFSNGVRDVALGEEEPIGIFPLDDNRVLVNVFANTLADPETLWTHAGKLAVIDLDTGEFALRELDDLEGGSCIGAWSIAPLDANHVAVACDGQTGGAAILDVSAARMGSVDDAAASISGCLADALLPLKTTQYVASDGAGGVIIPQTPVNATTEAANLWRYDAECRSVGTPGTLPAGESWRVAEILLAKAPTAGEPAKWLAARGGTKAAVEVIADGDGTSAPALCGSLPMIEPYLVDDMQRPRYEPHGLALTRAGDGLAIGAGIFAPSSTVGADGKLLWVELDSAADPCAASYVESVTDLGASAPAFDAADPQTWRRGPKVVYVVEQGA